MGTAMDLLSWDLDQDQSIGLLCNPLHHLSSKISFMVWFFLQLSGVVPGFVLIVTGPSATGAQGRRGCHGGRRGHNRWPGSRGSGWDLVRRQEQRKEEHAVIDVHFNLTWIGID